MKKLILLVWLMLAGFGFAQDVPVSLWDDCAGYLYSNVWNVGELPEDTFNLWQVSGPTPERNDYHWCLWNTNAIGRSEPTMQEMAAVTNAVLQGYEDAKTAPMILTLGHSKIISSTNGLQFLDRIISKGVEIEVTDGAGYILHDSQTNKWENTISVNGFELWVKTTASPEKNKAEKDKLKKAKKQVTDTAYERAIQAGKDSDLLLFLREIYGIPEK